MHSIYVPPVMPALLPVRRQGVRHLLGQLGLLQRHVHDQRRFYLLLLVATTADSWQMKRYVCA